MSPHGKVLPPCLLGDGGVICSDLKDGEAIVLELGLRTHVSMRMAALTFLMSMASGNDLTRFMQRGPQYS